MDVNGKVAVVTGGANGIGLELCARFAIVLSDRFRRAGRATAFAKSAG